MGTNSYDGMTDIQENIHVTWIWYL